jgi:uncharacterized membrane protein YbhN (UPF0104 family)
MKLRFRGLKIPAFAGMSGPQIVGLSAVPMSASDLENRKHGLDPGSAAALPARQRRPLRFILLALAASSFAVGLWTGLVRLGLDLPGGAPNLFEYHSAFMVSGFLGTVISLERAVALGRPWAFLAPVLSALGAASLLIGAPLLATIMFLAAAIALTANSAVVALRHPAAFTLLLAIAAGCWAAGTVAWMLGRGMPAVTGWWLLFLVLTIAAERLELSRLLSPPRFSAIAIVLIAALAIASAAREEFAGRSGVLSGVALLLLTWWLVRHDIARRTVRQSGQTRFSAVCMLAGYVWLAIAGLLMLLAPPGSRAFSYDAVIHAIAIGFVLSMIFGHAPIILPAVTGWRVRYSRLAYGPLGLLHLSVLTRVVADLAEAIDLRAASGVITVIALVSYAGVLVIASLRK